MEVKSPNQMSQITQQPWWHPAEIPRLISWITRVLCVDALRVEWNTENFLVCGENLSELKN